MLNINKLSFKYKNKLIFDDANLLIEDAGIYGIIAPNGRGKSTLLDLLSGLLVPQRGRITWNEKRLAYAQDTNVLYENLTPLDHIKLTQSLLNTSSNIQEYYLDAFGVNDFINIKVKNLSLGMKKRLMMSLSFMQDSDVILLDEPLNGLDVESITVIRSILLSEAKKNKTIIIASHNLDELEKVTNNIILINDKKLILKTVIGPLEDLYYEYY